MAEKAQQDDLRAKPVRSANEGSKDSKWANAKELKRGEDDTEYIKGKDDKSKAQKQRKEKNFLEVDMRFVEPPRAAGASPRGGRGGGDRGRGRGARGAGAGGRGGRGGGRGGAAGPTVDEKNFPTLGS